MGISNLNFNNRNNIQIESTRINNIKNQELNKNTSSKDITTNNNITISHNKDISNIKDLKDSKEINTQIKFNKNDINKTLSPFQKEILIKALSDKQRTELLKCLPIDINKIPIDNILKIMSNFMNVDVFLKFAQQLNNDDLKKILEKLPNDILNVLFKNINNKDIDTSRDNKIEEIISFTDNSVNYSPINGSQIYDVGLVFIEPELKKSPEELKKQLLSNNLINNNSEIKEVINKLLNKLPSTNKDSFIYLNMILDRRPAIETNKILECLNKLSQMIDNKNNYVPQIGSKTSFIISCLRDISVPTNISQGNIGTCNPTSMLIELAIRNPLKYLEIADKLAQNKSYEIKEQSGKTINSIKPNLTFAYNGNGVTDNTSRSSSLALMQNSIMDFSDGTKRDYNSSSPISEIKEGLSLFQSNIFKNMIYSDIGIKNLQEYSISPTTEFDGMNTANNESIKINGSLSNYTLMNILNENNPSINNPIQISMIYSSNSSDDSLHAVLVTGIDEKNVYIINPHGQEEGIPKDEFKKKLHSVSSNIDNAKKHIFDIDEIDKLTPEEIINKLTSSNILESMKITDIPYIYNKISNIKTDEVTQVTNKISNFISENINYISESETLLKQLRLYDFPLDNLLDTIKNNKNKSIDEKIKVLSSLDRVNDVLDLINDELKDSTESMVNQLSKISNYELTSWLDSNIEKISKENNPSTLVSSLIYVLFSNQDKLKSMNFDEKSIHELNEELTTRINNLINNISKNPNYKNILTDSVSKLGFNTDDLNSLIKKLNNENSNIHIGKVLNNLAHNLSK